MATNQYLDAARFSEAEFRKLFERFKTFAVDGASEDRIRHGKVLLSALLFCVESAELTVLAIERGYSLHEIILARPAMDLSLRMLFANRVPDGWARYEKYWLDQWSRWADYGSKQLPEHQAAFAAWGADAKSRLLNFAAFKAMPDKLPDLINEIFKAEKDIMAAGGDGMEHKRGSEFYNHVLFKVAHSVMHGDPGYLLPHLDNKLNETGYKRFASSDLTDASAIMLRAVYLFCGWPNREQDCIALLERSVKLRSQQP